MGRHAGSLPSFMSSSYTLSSARHSGKDQLIWRFCRHNDQIEISRACRPVSCRAPSADSRERKPGRDAKRRATSLQFPQHNGEEPELLRLSGKQYVEPEARACFTKRNRNRSWAILEQRNAMKKVWPIVPCEFPAKTYRCLVERTQSSEASHRPQKINFTEVNERPFSLTDRIRAGDLSLASK